MKKFLVLYKAPLASFEQMMQATPEQQKAGMDAWMAWAGKVGDALVDFGMPLGSSKHIESGSAGDGSNPASGFSILQADSLDAATGLAKNSPVLQGGGSVTVYEAFDVM